MCAVVCLVVSSDSARAGNVFSFLSLRLPRSSCGPRPRILFAPAPPPATPTTSPRVPRCWPSRFRCSLARLPGRRRVCGVPCTVARAAAPGSPCHLPVSLLSPVFSGTWDSSRTPSQVGLRLGSFIPLRFFSPVPFAPPPPPKASSSSLPSPGTSFLVSSPPRPFAGGPRRPGPPEPEGAGRPGAARPVAARTPARRKKRYVARTSQAGPDQGPSGVAPEAARIGRDPHPNQCFQGHPETSPLEPPAKSRLSSGSRAGRRPGRVPRTGLHDTQWLTRRLNLPQPFRKNNYFSTFVTVYRRL